MAVLLVVGLAAGPHLGAMSADRNGVEGEGAEGGASEQAAARSVAAPGQAAARSVAARGQAAARSAVAPGQAAARPAVAPARSRAHRRKARFVRPSRGALLIGSLVFALFMAEGAMTDWSALYLDRDLATGASLAAIGYGVFSGGMAIGRLTGDRLTRALGPARLLRAGALLAAAAAVVMVSVGEPIVAIPCLLLFGLGVANGVPLLFSAAGRVRDMAPGPAIAAVSTMGYFGLLAGPPLLGFVADATSLGLALAITALLTGAVALGARRAEG
jgi:fucose permease